MEGLNLGGVLNGLFGGIAGGAGGAGGLLGGAGGLLGGGDPLGMLVDVGAKMLGLPPMIKDAVKLGVGIGTGDLLCAAEGGIGLVGDVAQMASSQACQTQYAPAKNDEDHAGYARRSTGSCRPPPPPGGSSGCFPMPHAPQGPAAPRPPGQSGSSDPLQQELDAFRTLQNHFGEAESAGALFHLRDGKLAYGDLVAISNSMSSSPELKRAARYLLDHPESYAKIARTQPNPGYPPIATRQDLQIAIEDDQRAIDAKRNAPPPSSEGPRCGSDAPKKDGCGTPAPGKAPGAGTGDNWFSDIMNNPSMSIEDKIEAILMKLIHETEDETMDTLGQMNDSRTESAGLKDDDKSGKAKADNKQADIQFKLQKLQEKSKNLHDTLSTITASFNDMKKLCIQNMGRA